MTSKEEIPEKSDGEAISLSIHITSDQTVVKKSSKRPADENPAASQVAKRSKLTSTEPVLPSSIAPVASNVPSGSASLRHLFSFAPKQDALPTSTLLSEPSEVIEKKKKKKKKKAKPFTFFSRAENPVGIAGDALFLPKSDPQPTSDLPKHHPAPDTDVTPKPRDRRLHTDRRHEGDEPGASRDSMDESDESKEVPPSIPQSAVDKFEVYDDDVIMQAASMFCRQGAVEDLHQEWDDVDGLRDQMKRNFKLQRQNVSRGRKFGTSHPN